MHVGAVVVGLVGDDVVRVGVGVVGTGVVSVGVAGTLPHILIVVSSDPDAIFVPSGLHATEYT